MPLAATIEKLLLTASQGECISQIPDELSIYKEINKQRLVIQLSMLPDLVRTYNERNPQIAIKEVTNIRTLCEVMNDMASSKCMFSEVCMLLRILLTIPVTTSTAERTFSTLRRLKTFLRSTMTQNRLNHVMLLHIYKEKTDKIDLTKVATKFVSVNDRRRTFFGCYD